MEDRKRILDYLAQTIQVFGITIFVITFITLIVGESGKEVSTMFSLGNAGIPIATLLQYFLSSVCITGIRFLFFTDTIFKKMGIAARTISMVIVVVIMIGIFSYLFGWFPVTEAKCWLYFLVCFFVCFTISFFGSVWKESTDNKKLESGLKKLKESQDYGIH